MSIGLWQRAAPLRITRRIIAALVLGSAFSAAVVSCQTNNNVYPTRLDYDGPCNEEEELRGLTRSVEQALLKVTTGHESCPVRVTLWNTKNGEKRTERTETVQQRSTWIGEVAEEDPPQDGETEEAPKIPTWGAHFECLEGKECDFEADWGTKNDTFALINRKGGSHGSLPCGGDERIDIEAVHWTLDVKRINHGGCNLRIGLPQHDRLIELGPFDELKVTEDKITIVRGWWRDTVIHKPTTPGKLWIDCYHRNWSWVLNPDCQYEMELRAT